MPKPIPPEKARAIVDRYLSGRDSMRAIAAEHGISMPTVSRLVKFSGRAREFELDTTPDKRRSLPRPTGVHSRLYAAMCTLPDGVLLPTARIARSMDWTDAHTSCVLRDLRQLGWVDRYSAGVQSRYMWKLSAKGMQARREQAPISPPSHAASNKAPLANL